MAGLISREALKTRLGQAGLVPVDLRLAADGGRESYLAGHVPRAICSGQSMFSQKWILVLRNNMRPEKREIMHPS